MCLLESRKMSVGNFISLLQVNFREKGFLTVSACGPLRLGAKFPIAFNKSTKKGCHEAPCWSGEAGLAILVSVTIAQSHLHPNKHCWCCFRLCVPIAYRALCWIPVPCQFLPTRFTLHKSKLWTLLGLPRSADSKVASQRSRSCWISPPALHHQDHLPQ